MLYPQLYSFFMVCWFKFCFGCVNFLLLTSFMVRHSNSRLSQPLPRLWSYLSDFESILACTFIYMPANWSLCRLYSFTRQLQVWWGFSTVLGGMLNSLVARFSLTAEEIPMGLRYLVLTTCWNVFCCCLKVCIWRNFHIRRLVYFFFPSFLASPFESVSQG